MAQRECSVFVEVATIEDREVNVFANIAFGDDGVDTRMLDAVADDVEECGLLHRADAIRKHLFQMDRSCDLQRTSG